MPDPVITEWPTDWYSFVTAKFYLRSFSQMSISAWTSRRNVSGPHAQLWFCELTLPPMEKTTWMNIEALIAELGGQSGLLRIGDPARLEPQRNAESAGTIVGFSDGTFFDDGSGFNSTQLPATIVTTADALAGAGTITVSGLPVSSTRVLRRNDLIEAQPGGAYDSTPRLYMLTRDSDTDSGGETSLNIKPNLRDTILAGTSIVLNYPQSVFRLQDDEQGVIERTSPTIGNGAFKLVEAIV